MSAACCSPGRDGPDDGLHGVAAVHDVRPATQRTAIATMVGLPGGTFRMGSDGREVNGGDGEGPVRAVDVAPFSIDTVAVVNVRFATFVKATGYVTDAERYGWSFVFHLLVDPAIDRMIDAVPAATPWWRPVPGATWRAPEGPGSDIGARQKHPVVHVSHHDAVAYCEWSGTRLPTEAEWEYAARGGLDGATYAWGNELTPGGRHMCNIWQGRFPAHNTKDDGYLGAAPVTAYPANGYGLHNVAGNVWEWCSDWFSVDWHATASRTDPQGPPSGEARVMRGGSYLCHQSYCNRYRVSARTSNTPDSSAGNIGFRVARSL